MDLGIVISILIILLLLVSLLRFIPVGLWITAMFSGVKISILTLVGMNIR